MNFHFIYRGQSIYESQSTNNKLADKSKNNFRRGIKVAPTTLREISILRQLSSHPGGFNRIYL